MDEIKVLIKERKVLEENFDEFESEIDQIDDQIFEYIRNNSDSLPLEFIITTLNNIGHSICMVYDDNGKYAFTGDGFSDIATDNTPTSVITCIIEPDKWSDDIRTALKIYLNE